MRLYSRVALLACFGGLLPMAAGDPAAKQEYPPAKEIIAKAVEWARWHHDQKFYKRWRLEHVYTARHLNDAEAVQSTETRSFQVYPLAGEQFYELETRDGQPLSRSDLRKEAKRKREFIEKANEKAAGNSAPDDEEEEEFDFDHELVSRYRAEVIGLEEIAGRQAYVLTFEPKEGPLPVRRRADHALNHSRGKLWIDSKDFVVLQVDFELMEPVRLWGGILGSLSRMHGRLTLTELGGGAWHYKHLDVYVKGRVLVKSFHQDMRLEWKDFLPLETSGGL